MERATPAGTVVWTIIAAVLAVLVGSVELALIILVAGLVTALIITVRSKREAQAPAKTSHPTQVENPLRARLRSLPFMSGEEFEYYMADVFRSLGWSVRVLGGSGDQGVDLLVDDGGVLIAVQCKHHKRPVNNAAVQQVFAGAQHYRANQAWVVSPSGFTESAFDLARSTNVRLFDSGAIKQWVQEVEQQKEGQTQPAPREGRTVELDGASSEQKGSTMGESNMEKHSISVGTPAMGETVAFTAELLGTAKVNGGKKVADASGMDWTYYRLPDHTYRVLIDNGSTRMLLPSNMDEAWTRGEAVEYGRWTLEELQNEGEYGRIFGLLMEERTEGRKPSVRDLD